MLKAFCWPHALLVCLALAANSSALAWGMAGHRLIATVAEPLLAPATQTALAPLLQGETVVTVSTWADDMRDSEIAPAFWATAKYWHYVNLEPGRDYDHSRKDRHGDVIVAIATFTAMLKQQPVPQGPVRTALESVLGLHDLHSTAARSFAVKFLIHLLGDLQQPLHCGYAIDHGGNDLAMDWYGKHTNLHSVWDTQLLSRRHLGEKRYAERLTNQLQHMPATELSSLQSTTIQPWLADCAALLQRIHGSGTLMSNEAYTAEFLPVAERQLITGAVRTAAYLNSLFATPAP